jgi:hypothetical protein
MTDGDLGGTLRSQSQKDHDLAMVAAWRETLAAVVTEAELAFRVIEDDDTFRPGAPAGMVPVLRAAQRQFDQRLMALSGMMAHAANYVELIALGGPR